MANNVGNLTGQTLGTCVLEQLIGQGGMGTVYSARQTRPARHVAVKVFYPTGVTSDKVYEEFLARFRREADVIARLEHVNIMPIYEYGEQDGLAYLVMPYLTGGSLRDVLEQRGALSLQEAATYMDQAASALDYAHAQGVIHRDLKPANFLLHADGRLVLADFGIARIMEEGNSSGNTLTGMGTILGTPEYMAPEMGTGDPVDYRADIYELGVVLFQMLSGHVPFSGTTPYAILLKQMQARLPNLSQLNPSIPPAVDVVIQKATEKRREDRYSTTRAMAQALHIAIVAPTAYANNDGYGAPTVAVSPLPQQVIIPPMPQYVPPDTLSPRLARTQYTAPGNTYAPPITPYNTLNTNPPRKNQALLWILGVLVALLLIMGGIFAGVQLSKGQTATTPGVGTATVGHTPVSTPTTHITPTITPKPSPTKPVTPTTGITPTTQPTTPPGNLQLGTQLYATSTPGQHCEAHGGQWTDFNGINISCQGARSRLTNTTQGNLQGTFLTSLPGGNYPSDYIIQAQIRQPSNSAADYGIYFRNQPGSNQQGTYTFLVHPNATWSAYVYDNASGNRTEIARGNFGDPRAQITLDIMVVGSQFTFYANGHLLGTVSDTTYTSGTAGIAVDQGGTIYVNNFSVYAPAGQ